MRTVISRRAVVLGLGTSLLVLIALGSVALATRPAAIPDFAPFTMRVTWWTAAAIQRPGLPAEAGTAVQILEYRNIDSWKLTTVSSSWDPGVVGTAIEVNDHTHSTFLAQVHKLVSRVVPADEPSMVPFRWLVPGLIDALPQQGFTRADGAAVGRATYIENGARTVTRADGTVDVLDGTVVAFDAASHLPVSVKRYRDGAPLESFDFEITSRP